MDKKVFPIKSLGAKETTARETTAPEPVSNGAGVTRDDEVAECPPQKGYRLCWWRCVVVIPLALLPLGLGLLLAYWLPHLWVRLICRRCNLAQARYVIVKDLAGHFRVENVHTVTLETTPTDNLCDENPQPYVGKLPENIAFLSNTTLRYFEHRHLRYVYTPIVEKYVLLKGFDEGYSCDAIHGMRGGLHTQQHKDRLLRYGPNSISVPVKSYHMLLIDEVLHPFYIFQVVSVVFWMLDEYYFYSCAVFFISTLSLLISLLQTRRQMQQLHDMVASSCTVTVMRDGREFKDVPGESLVPGDILVVPATGMTVPCDAALLTGSAIVNEAMLTGESVPVTKTPLPHSPSLPHHPDKHKRHTLFGGTKVIQTRFYGNASVHAVVVRTSFSTSKGRMVRSILFPKPLNVRFYWDALKFVLVMAFIALLGFTYTLAILFYKHYDIEETFLRAFDVITIVVPPALPAALTVGTVYAVARLRKEKIYCISPQRVNLCGKVKLVCFDKTGTLTEDSLDLHGVMPCSGSGFSPLTEDARQLPPGPLLFGMATCHSLTTIAGELAGDPLDLKMFQATGWSLEEPGEDSTRFDSLIPVVIHPPSSLHFPPTLVGEAEDEQQLELGVLRQFPFSSELQRMSVLVRALPSSDPRLLHVYVKGAPETIRRLCRPETVPEVFLATLASLTQQGFRVLALAHRSMHLAWHKAERVQRSVVECELSFAGLLVMQNRLKPQTTPTLATLTRAGIRTVMITGDNLLTAVSVARECSMIPLQHRTVVVKALPGTGGRPDVSFHRLDEGRDHTHLLSSAKLAAPPKLDGPDDGDTASPPDAPLLSYHEEEGHGLGQFSLVIDGKSFALVQEHCKDTFERLLVRGTVFARMSPDQKAQLVSSLMSLGYGVAMCGDGANDCGALKTAHAGISLSDTEASVASPFTSKVPDITCVPKVIKEGRAALVTSFSVFKFMALYSCAEFISAAILYSYESNLGDFMYLYIDLVLILAFAFVMGFTGPYSRLVKRRPPGTLAGVHVLSSLVVQALLLVLVQVSALLYLKSRPWYDPLVPDPEETNVLSSESTVVFTISIFQYVGLAVALSTAAPYRRALYTNYWFMLCLAVLIPLNLYIALAPHEWWPWFWDHAQLAPPPHFLFRLGIVELGTVHFVLAYFLEGYIFTAGWFHRFLRVLKCKRRSHNRYKHVLAAIEPDWPPLAHEGGLQVPATSTGAIQ